MKNLFLTILFLSVLQAGAQSRPNIIFIMADDLGYGDLGCYGQAIIATPNLDRMAKNGIRFTQFYSGTSVCAPSRSALITGQHTGHTPIRGNFEVKPEGQYPLPDATFTMAEMFKKGGYATGVFGKWGLGYPGSTGEPLKQGFDRFFGYNCQREAHNYFPAFLWNNNNRIQFANTTTNLVQYAPDAIQEQALTFMANHKAQPFFMFMAYTLPHAGLQLPAGDENFEKYKQALGEVAKPVSANWNGIDYQPQAYPKAAYAAMVTKLDAYVGDIVNKLKALGIEKNTLIIFTSDNGPHWEGGYKPEFFNSNGGLRGAKWDLFEGGIRAPMIAYWPAAIPKGRTSDYIGAVWDFFPTFAQLAGQPIPKNTDGISLVGELTGRGKQKKHSFLYWEFHGAGGRQAVRMGNWKGVRLNVMKDSHAPLLLYNLTTDLQETTDVSAQHPEIVKKIEQLMKEQHTEAEGFPFLQKEGAD